MDEYEAEFEEWLTDTVTVRRALGIGPKGAVLSEPETVETVMVNYKHRIVRASLADSAVSDAQITGPRRLAVHFPPQSEVTLPDGQVRQVLSLAVDAESVPLAHMRVVLV